MWAPSLSRLQTNWEDHYTRSSPDYPSTAPMESQLSLFLTDTTLNLSSKNLAAELVHQSHRRLHPPHSSSPWRNFG